MSEYVTDRMPEYMRNIKFQINVRIYTYIYILITNKNSDGMSEFLTDRMPEYTTHRSSDRM